MNESEFGKNFLEVPPGYTPHETRIEYEYAFPNGEKLEVREQPDGTVQIVIKLGKRIIFDFAGLLPRDYKFVSYPYVAHLENKTGEDIPWVGWMAVPKWKHIQVGEFESPEDIIGLLHEIGHVINYENEERGAKTNKFEHEREKLKKEESQYTKDPDLFLLHQEEIAKIMSKTERDAWAYALWALRKLEQELKIDLKDIFPDLQSVKQVVNSELATYRASFEWLAEKDPSFVPELEKLFDRGFKKQ